MNISSRVRHAKQGALSAAACLVAAAIITLSTINSASAESAKSNGPKPTIVLVHGAWADASSWSRVVRHLQHDGYTVDAVPNPLRGVHADAAYLASFLSTVSGPIVLVGHSYGGSIITNAAVGNPSIKALVYVDAFLPDQGESVLQLANAGGSCLGGGGDPTKVFKFVPYPDAPAGDVDLYAKPGANDPYPGFAQCFANDEPAQAAAVLAATQRPVALSALAEPSGTPAWKTIPSWAVIGTIDNVIPAAGQLDMAHRANAHITQIRAAHLSMISRPDAVADVIDIAAHATT